MAPRVTLNLAGRKTKFLVATGATCSVLTRSAGPLSNHDCIVKGFDGQPKAGRFTSPLAYGIRSIIITHSLLYMPECPVPLLGRDLLSKLGASVFLGQGEVQGDREFKQRMHRLIAPGDPPAGHQNIPQDIPQEIRECVDPAFWDTSVPGRVKRLPSIKVRLRPGEKYPWKRQYPLKVRGPEGNQLLLSKFLKHGLIRPCQSPCNTPDPPRSEA